MRGKADVDVALFLGVVQEIFDRGDALFVSFGRAGAKGFGVRADVGRAQ